ncbi:hypothetical protein SUGI_0669510 [Cryptomeria japonica]|nr:hypothetical protein SUGI_0669510 [Cryptomeria japonica]
MASTSRRPEFEISNAFEGIAPSASTSGRSTERKLPYDSFPLCSKRGIPIIPFFYHVELADVRYATGAFAKAFSSYTGKCIYALEKIEKWKDALNNVSYKVGGINHNEE